jgi:alkylhydroperoxidase family enzyme
MNIQKIVWIIPLAGLLGLIAAPDRAVAQEGARAVSILSDAECWERLPAPKSGRSAPLPNWAKVVAVHFPRTAASLLELDLVHRTKSPIDPGLRSAMRWVIARANRCAYAEATAIADARRADVSDADISRLQSGDLAGFRPEDRAALEFAKKMTLASSEVTDAEFASLVKSFGAEKVAAMVLLCAYGNFQDRLLLSLGVPPEPDGPLAPVEVAFEPSSLATKMAAPQRTEPRPLGDVKRLDIVNDEPSWTAIPFESLQSKLETQRSRPTRLTVPPWSEVEQNLPQGFTRPTRIVWNLICLGYAPKLAMPWETLMRTNGAEGGSKVDRVFSLSLFWVVTRAIDCPYCMGHCEMNWEVAGLDTARISERSRVLASADWSPFPEEEQRALALARKLTQTPWAVTQEETSQLARDFGPDRALQILLYASRCNYMTRISNGFQLTLERDNVFWEYYGVEPPKTTATKTPASTTDEVRPAADEKRAGQPQVPK